MARQPQDVDWYVDLSERLERREHRRKWIVLGVCVAVPLLAMGGFLLYIVLDRSGLLTRLRGAVHMTAPDKLVAPKEVPIGPASVEGPLQKDDVRFPQLDNDGLITSMNHYFRELKPDKADVFTVNRVSDEQGTVLNYRLLNIGTADVYDFRDIPVKKIGGAWTITEEGWNVIRDALQARMRVRLGRPTM
ncbi:MAG TPA: hypothetical protein VNE39_20750 [Planctomycetota bacterium]|nr:hypothetical protein [Planctomycetota bacterium]